MTVTAQYTVQYDTSNQLGVLFQCLGSAWPRVIPYCIFNVLIMLTLWYIQDVMEYNQYHLQISNMGHGMISLVVSFLLVSRVTTALGRYNEGQNYLTQMYRESRELTQRMVILSQKQNLLFLRSKHSEAPRRQTGPQEWRNEVAHRTMLVLRTVAACMVYPTSKVPAWNVPELFLSKPSSRGSAGEGGMKRTSSKRIPTPELSFIKNGLHHKIRRWAHGFVQEDDFLDTLRVPVRCAYLLRESILSHAERLPNPLPIQNEVMLLGSVDSIVNGFYGMRMLLTTPAPFPLVQMCRTIVYLYVFTMPFVFETDTATKIVPHCLTVFLLTYGFVGLELIAVELDNPYGDDDNDFDCLSLVQSAFEDIYITIRDADGTDWAEQLRFKMHDLDEDDMTEAQLARAQRVAAAATGSVRPSYILS